MTPQYCSSCWHEIEGEASFCPNCKSTHLCSEEMLAGTLMTCLSHPVREYRLIAVESLGNIRYEPAQPYLTSIVQSEQDTEMRDAAVESIKKIHLYWQNSDQETRTVFYEKSDMSEHTFR
ncbi:HEAT repeat domain-containing protein [Methanospirillum hungatei]|uniref:HEAT repeat domain-containing protein n=1 Tax=Methanospirillum hungatei TaxID=2203 RepID=UPI0026E9D620|nr:HEAT repeat domain-containing protein [Methanospirillum hungatei]MCA1917405.1 HEAT repeat domain-containing protein [Methanospirillum hungatei]